MCVLSSIHRVGFGLDFYFFFCTSKYFGVVLSVSCRESNVIFIQSESFTCLKT